MHEIPKRFPCTFEAHLPSGMDRREKRLGLQLLQHAAWKICRRIDLVVAQFRLARRYIEPSRRRPWRKHVRLPRMVTTGRRSRTGTLACGEIIQLKVNVGQRRSTPGGLLLVLAR